MHYHHLQAVSILTTPQGVYLHKLNTIVLLTLLKQIFRTRHKAKMDLLAIMQQCQASEVHPCRVYCTIHYTTHMLLTL